MTLATCRSHRHPHCVIICSIEPMTVHPWTSSAQCVRSFSTLVMLGSIWRSMLFSSLSERSRNNKVLEHEIYSIARPGPILKNFHAENLGFNGMGCPSRKVGRICMMPTLNSSNLLEAGRPSRTLKSYSRPSNICNER